MNSHIFTLVLSSERVHKSKISGTALEEAKHINLSLHYLEQVILALSQTKRSHIPYRNSMMTYLLRDSLSGNGFTIMLATLGLHRNNFDVNRPKFANPFVYNQKTGDDFHLQVCSEGFDDEHGSQNERRGGPPRGDSSAEGRGVGAAKATVAPEKRRSERKAAGLFAGQAFWFRFKRSCRKKRSSTARIW